jgi:hypothetical protein
MIELYLAAIWLTGFGIVRWMFPRPLRLSLHNVLLFSLGTGVGAGVASCVYFAALALAGPGMAVLASACGVVLVIALAPGLLSKPGSIELDWGESSPTPWYLTASFLLAVLVAVIMFVAAVSFNPHGDEGAWSIWNMRARYLFRAGAFWRDAFSSDLGWTHPDYPLLVPGLVALCWKLIGQESTDAPIAIAFLFILGTTGVLAGTLGVLRDRTHAFLGGTLLLGTASFIALGAALYGDVPLSFYILATLALLALQDRNPADLRFSALAGLMAGFAAWTRNEGAIFVAAVLLARVFVLLRSGAKAALAPQLLRFIVGAAAPLAVLVTFKLRVAGPSDTLSTPASEILNHLADPARWITMLEGLAVVLFTMGRFVIPIVLVLALYWYLVRFKIAPRDRTTLSSAVIALAVTFVVQVLVDILYAKNLPVEIATSLERIFLQLWPAFLMVFFLASGPLDLVNTSPGDPRQSAARGKSPTHAAKPGRTKTGARVPKPAEHSWR